MNRGVRSDPRWASSAGVGRRAAAPAHGAVASSWLRGDRYGRLTLLLLCAVLACDLVYVGAHVVGLSPEEAQYWDWSRHLDWSYYTKGPMAAWLIAASTRLGGDSEFFVRLPAMLLSLGSGALLALLGYRLFSATRVAFLTALLCTACPLFVAGSMLMTTDAPWMFCWALGVFGLEHAVRGAGRAALAWWLVAGAALGLGLLAKYTMLLFLPCVATYMLVWPPARAWLRRREPYLALVVAAILFTPVVYWNWRHSWGSLAHVAWQAGLDDGGLHVSARTLLNFVGGQAIVVSPLLLLAAIGAAVRSGRRAWRDSASAAGLLFAFSAPPLLFFLLWSLIAKVQANWAAVAYGPAFIALAALWHRRFEPAGRPRDRRRALWRLALLLIPGYATIAAVLFPGLLPLARLGISPRSHPTLRTTEGWQLLGARVSRILETDAGKPFVMSDRYQITSELAFYVAGHPRTYNLPIDQRTNQYQIWGGTDELRGRDGLFVTYGSFGAPPGLYTACASVRALEVVEVRHGDQPVEWFSIVRCQGFRGLSQPPSTS